MIELESYDHFSSQYVIQHPAAMEKLKRICQNCIALFCKFYLNLSRKIHMYPLVYSVHSLMCIRPEFQHDQIKMTNKNIITALTLPEAQRWFAAPLQLSEISPSQLTYWDQCWQAPVKHIGGVHVHWNAISFTYEPPSWPPSWIFWLFI